MDFNWQFWGNNKTKKILEQVVKKNNPASCYLFVGMPQIGKATAAKEFALALNCENQNQIPCFKCLSCHQIYNEESADIIFLRGEESLKIEEIRELKRMLNLKNHYLRYKIAFLENAERLTEEAANALLKILEEPPGKTVFILTVSSIKKILPTIVSRSQIIKMQPLSLKAIEDYLFEKTKDKTLSEYLALISGGRPGVALGLLENSELLQKNIEILKKFLEAKDKDVFEKIKFVDEISNSQILLPNILDFWLYFIRDIMLFKNGNENLISNMTLKKIIINSAQKYSFEHLFELAGLVHRTKMLLEKNVKPRLALEVLMLEI